MPFLKAPLLVALALAVACPGAQVKGGSGGVNVVLRRVDVVEADFDKMTLQVIVAVENQSSSDANVSADARLAIVGEAPADADEAKPGAAPATDAQPTDEEAEAEEEERTVPESDDEAQPTGGTTPIDGTRHAGTGAGSAPSHNTSELPITIEVPLPSDPALLEQMLEWKKMLVHIDGNVRVGLSTIPLSGHREIAPPHLPTVKLKEAQVASVDDGKAGTGFFTILLDNKNPFPVTIDRMAWTVSIKDKALQPSSGVLDVTRDTVPASAVGEYQTEVQINETRFGKELKALLRNPTVPYVIEGTLEVRGITRSFRFAGDMKFAR
jgi:LEA14-like dessication related protein